MRIIGGHFKGRVLQSVEGKGTRPTDARAREMLFNVLGERPIGARVLDLYGGTGGLGLEALSRGAEFCVFIEQNAGACRVIKANLKTLQVSGAAQVWQATVKSALRRLAEDGAQFDLIFADPPFSNLKELSDLCKALDSAVALLHNEPGRHPDASSTLSPSPAPTDGPNDPVPAVPCGEDEDGEAVSVHAGATFLPMLVIQHHRKQAPTLGAPYRLWREKRAGESTLSFFVLDFESGEAERGAGSNEGSSDDFLERDAS